MQQQHALAALACELINEQACAAEENIGSALYECEAVIDIAGRYQELMLAHLNHLSGPQAQRNDLAH